MMKENTQTGGTIYYYYYFTCFVIHNTFTECVVGCWETFMYKLINSRFSKNSNKINYCLTGKLIHQFPAVNPSPGRVNYSILLLGFIDNNVI